MCSLVQADLPLARLAGVVPRLLTWQWLGEAVRAITVRQDAPIALPTVSVRPVMAVEADP